MLNPFDSLDGYKICLESMISKVDMEMTWQASHKVLNPEHGRNDIGLIYEMIINCANYLNASDIHIESLSDKLDVRMRVTNLLINVVSIPKKVGDFLLNYIKLIAKLDIAEKRFPQDGAIYYEKLKLDIRCSVIPVVYGETIVLRLLGNDDSLYALEQIIHNYMDREKLIQLLEHRSGLIAISGKVNSGKSTLMYSIIDYLRHKKLNIITIEDPVEIKMQGINQMQINSYCGFKYIDGIRAALRQDPDVLMIGEIRDSYVAAEAVQAALTGHLVLTTIHAEDAFSVPARFINLGIEREMLAITLKAVIAQVLVSTLCPECREIDEDYNRDEAIICLGEYYHDNLQLYKSNGCNSCNFTGHLNRESYQDIVIVDSVLREMIRRGAVGLEFKKQALLLAELNEPQMISALRDLVLNGRITVEEMWRVYNGI